MKLNDLIALAKQGYKITDIRELVELADDKEQSETEQKEKKDKPEKVETEQKEKKDKPEKVETEKTDDGGTEGNKPEKDSENAVDYKALFLAEKEKVEKLQKQNIKKDNSGNEHDDEEKILEDIVRNFM